MFVNSGYIQSERHHIAGYYLWHGYTVTENLITYIKQSRAILGQNYLSLDIFGFQRK